MDHSDSVLVVGSGSIDHLCNNSPVLNDRKAHETPTWPVTTLMPVLRGLSSPGPICHGSTVHSLRKCFPLANLQLACSVQV